MSKELKSKEIDQLFDAILSLKTREECYAFFTDCCTVTELQSLAARFEVARLLNSNIPYLEISQLTGASSATVSRVGRALHYGEDGYQLVLSRLNEKEDSSEQDKE